MKEEIELVLKELKLKNWPASKIEKELEISNGLLGKAAKGLTKLSDEKYRKIMEFYRSKVHPTVTTATNSKEEITYIQVPVSNEPIVFSGPQFLPEWAEKIKENCRTIGITYDELWEGYMKWRAIEMADKPKVTAGPKIRDLNIEAIKGGNPNYDPTKNWRYNAKIGNKEK